MERTIASLSQMVAMRGNSSQICMPGTLVLMGLNSPRISTGASGFGSKVSCWGGPPCNQRNITFFALPKVLPRSGLLEALNCASSNMGRVRPIAARPPTCSSSLRFKLFWFSKILNMKIEPQAVLHLIAYL